MIVLILIILLIYSLYKWWIYKNLSIGLMYFAKVNHDWNIDEKEMKKILEYSIKRNFKDFMN